MLKYSDIDILESLSSGIGLDKLQTIFDANVSELSSYLRLDPLYKKIIIKLISQKNQKAKTILDLGVDRTIRNTTLTILIYETNKEFLPFILLREAYYCFLPENTSDLVKICINQIVENDLNRLSGSKKWKKLMKNSLVNKEFIDSELDRLQKFFKIEAEAPLESTIQYFFNEIRKNRLLCQSDTIDRFYDIIFEGYTLKNSLSLFNPDIIEALRIIVQIFYETKSYLSLTDYQALFRKYEENKKIDSKLSIRKFTESTQWINKCSSIAPAYDYDYNKVGLYGINAFLKFNPLLEKSKIKSLIEETPFFYLSKVEVNSFALNLSVSFHVPYVYIKDFLHYLNWLQECKFVINMKVLFTRHKTDFINLNYYMDSANIRKVIDPNNNTYEKKYEIEYQMDYTSKSQFLALSLFDYTMLERIKFSSVTGLTFDKRVETLNNIKEDIENELLNQQDITNKFKENLNIVIKYKSQFLQFLDEYHCFYYAYSHLNQMLTSLHLLEEFLKEHPEIRNINQLWLSLTTFSQNIEDQLHIHNKRIQKVLLRDFFPLYFRSNRLFKEELEKIQSFFNVLDSCYTLKIVNLDYVKKIVKDQSLAKEIYYTRKRKYEKIFKDASPYTITNKRIESWIETFLAYNPPIIKPALISTIYNFFAKYYVEAVLEDTPSVHEKLEKFKLYFPRIFIIKTKELNTNKNFIRLLIYSINIKEKKDFLSAFYSCFRKNIIKSNRSFWRGVMRRVKFEARDFYDFEKGAFFYSEDIFKEMQLYTQKILGEKLKWPVYILNNEAYGFDLFWSPKNKMNDLIKTVKKRVSNQRIEFSMKELDALISFRNHLIYLNAYKDFSDKQFLKKFIKSIKFIPAFHKFGFSQYCLYLRPFFYKSPTYTINFRLLLGNSFQKVKYPASIESNPGLYCIYIFPYQNPNTSYLNWLIKSQKIISEYCMFNKRKFYDIFHTHRNLIKEGWDYSSIRFKSYIQEILFNPTYDPKISGVREFELCKESDTNIYGYKTQEFKALAQLYNTDSIDMKSYLGLPLSNNLNVLLEKKLIFPYLSLKNLDFQDKVSIILPNLKRKVFETLIKVFSFFNKCHIYEIEGEFYIYGFEDIVQFENGLLIEIWFPQCEIDEFFEVFDLLFQYFEIKYYLILTDLVNGKHLLKSVYSNLEFLDFYNPLKNLIWNESDNIWMNHKLFGKRFELLYPDLLYGEKETSHKN